MLAYFHLILASGLLISHMLFSLRGIYLIKRHGSPTAADRLFRRLSSMLLPLTLLTGFLKLGKGDLPTPVHLIAALMPLVLLLVFTFARKWKKRRPWGLPLLVLLCLTIAWISGIRALF